MNSLSTNFLMICFFIQAVGCAPKHTSEWATLDNVESIDCSPWPTSEQDLRTDDMFMFSNKDLVFVAKGRLRNRSPVYYAAKYQGDIELEHEKLNRLTLGRTAKILGGTFLHKKPRIAVLQQKGKKNLLELRSLKNVVTHSLPIAAKFSSGRILANHTRSVRDGFWILLNGDEPTHNLRYIQASKNRLASKPKTGWNFKNRPVLLELPDPKTKIAIMRSDQQNKPFILQGILPAGKRSKPVALTIPVKSGIESWDAFTNGDRFYVAYVDGDSLVGDATLRISSITWEYDRPKVLWNKSMPLADEHVTEPVLIRQGRDLQVLILKWVDGESTLAAYKVKGSNVLPPVVSGIFPKGSRIIDATSIPGESPIVILRSKEGLKWNYSICKLDNVS